MRELGQDPAGESAGAKFKSGETFGAIAQRYLARQRTRLRPRSYSEIERHLLKHSRALHGLQLEKITRRDVAAVISAVAETSGPVTGNRVRTSLSCFFVWAIREGLIEANPAANTNKARRVRTIADASQCRFARLIASDRAPTKTRLKAQVASRLNQLRDTNLRPK